MMYPLDRTTARRIARLILAGAAVLVAQQSAAASGDDGVRQFFSAIFGGGAAQTVATPAPVQRSPGNREVPYRTHVRPFRDHPLTVRLHRAKPKAVAAQLPTKPGKVSIFDDGTLRRGDAVMTERGIRIFAGSRALPHASSDFVGLTASKDLSRDITKVLAEMDRLPRG